MRRKALLLFASFLVMVIGCESEPPESIRRRPIGEHEFGALEVVSRQDSGGYFMAFFSAWARAPGDECAVTKDAWARVEPGAEFDVVSLGENKAPIHPCTLDFKIERFLGAEIEGGADEQDLTLGGGSGGVAGMRGVGIVGRRSFEAVLGTAAEEPMLTLLWSHDDAILPPLRVMVKEGGEGFVVTDDIRQEGRSIQVPLPHRPDPSALVSVVGAAAIQLTECFGAAQCAAEIAFSIGDVAISGESLADLAP